ncbi:MAG: general secretion pathway protein I [Flavobacteriales bacterium]|jgi:general secretion pathway protein I
MKIFRHRHGFALIEVMVALAVVGLALPALLLRMQAIVQDTTYYENKTFAHWVADNKMQELIVDQKLGKKISSLRKKDDIIEYGDREWWWTVTTEEVPLPPPLDVGNKYFKVIVDVGLNDERESGNEKSLASLTGFIDE